MSILIDVVRVAGFRGIEDIEIPFSRVAVLIGANNSGKTSVIKALQLALGDYSRYISEEDFYIDENDCAAESVLVDLRIIPVNVNGERIDVFDADWLEEFEDRVQSEASGKQFFALRTKCQRDTIKGGFSTERFALKIWPEYEHWKEEVPSRQKPVRKKFDSLPFISIDAQRDIHSELRERSSFIGKVLSSIEYETSDIEHLESMVAAINEEAVKKSEPLKALKTHLERLNKSFNGSGEAEITPFPKKIRDLSKQFTVHFGEKENSSFSMEYHGMGTRSWASMLTVKAFEDLMENKHKEEEKPFFPVVAAEEPEAHLHPNAQRAIYKQLVQSNGQVIISSHSPYLAALADQSELRILSISGDRASVNRLNEDIEPEDRRKIQREVIHSRGEILFSKAIVLSEGETEEQTLPLLFEKYFGEDAFSLGIDFIGVSGSGAKYRPFLIFAHDFDIPVFIFSDGEDKTISDLTSHYERVFGETDINMAENITILENTDFEGYLLESGYEKVIEEAIKNVDGDEKIDQWIRRRHGTPMRAVKSDKPSCETCNQPIFESPLRDYENEDGRYKAMLDILDTKKPKYAKVVAEELCKLEPEEMPGKIIELFEQIKSGVKL